MAFKITIVSIAFLILTLFQIIQLKPSNAINTQELHTNNNNNNGSLLYYGWFFNESIANSLTTIYHSNYLTNLYLNLTEVETFLQNTSIKYGIKDPLKYYTKPFDPATGKFDPYYHVTSMFCGGNKNCTTYTNKIQPYLNKEFNMNLIGYYFTERTFGIRILLTDEQKEIFDESTTRNLKKSRKRKPWTPWTTWTSSNRRLRRRIMTNAINYDGIEFVDQELNFNPSNSKAHITLGCGPGIPAVQTGLDLIDIVKYEQATAVEASKAENSSISFQEYKIENGILRKYLYKNSTDNGQDLINVIAFVFYPYKKIVTTATFEAYFMPLNSSSAIAVNMNWISICLFGILLNSIHWIK